MSNDITPDLIKSLISSVDSTNETVKELASSVAELVQVEKVREERDRHQEEKNAKYDKFIDESRDTISWAKSMKQLLQKASVPILVIFVVTFFTLLGFNFKG